MINITAIDHAPHDNLADQIRDDLRRREGAREQWIEATLDFFTHMVEARDQFTADKEFGQWLRDNGLGPDVLNDHDRAAALSMGRHLQEARTVLEKTERRSLQYIHREEFKPRFAELSSKPADEPEDADPSRFAYASKPADEPAETAAEPVAEGERSPNSGTAVAVPGSALLDARGKPKAEGKRKMRQDRPDREIRRAISLNPEVWEIILQQAAAEGTSGDAMLGKWATERALPSVEREELSLTAQQKIDSAVRKHQIDLNARFEEKVRAEVKKRLEELVLPLYQQKSKDAERIIKARKSIMPRATYRKILAALHPDDAMSKDAKRAAFESFKELELVLVGEAEMPTSSGTMPSSLEELMKMRKTKRR